MLNVDGDNLSCSECGHSTLDLSRFSHCPKCKAALHTDKTTDTQRIIAANNRFLVLLRKAIDTDGDVLLRFCVKVGRGKLSSIKLLTDEDWRLDAEG